MPDIPFQRANKMHSERYPMPTKLWNMMKTDFFAFHGFFDDLPFQTILEGFMHAYPEDMIKRWMDLSRHAGRGT